MNDLKAKLKQMWTWFWDTTTIDEKVEEKVAED